MAVVFAPQPPRRPAGRASRLPAVLAVGLLAVAVLKPWSSTADDDATADATPMPTSPALDRRLPRPHAVERAIQRHDAWGVRAIVESAVDGGSAARRVEELWEAVEPAPAGAIPSVSGVTADAARFRVGDRLVRLIGLTVPPAVGSPNVHVIVARPLGRVQTVAVRRVLVRRHGDDVPLLAPAAGGAWEPGVYQLRIGAGDSRFALTVAIFRAGSADSSRR
ncbi:MAG TPA: hypothetical protein VM344_05080 [Vitreimonas sp.]|nr:hypothetical protein [Vitreimonas sp.]